jgi:hypothetical protein
MFFRFRTTILYVPPDVSPGGREGGGVFLHSVLPCAEYDVFQVTILVDALAILEEDFSVRRVHLHVHATKVCIRENPLARREEVQQLKTK